MHIWFWFDRPISDAQLKAWGKSHNAKMGQKIVDTALFNDVQAHYTAAPMFMGMADPFPVRSGLVRKRLDEVVLQLPAPSGRTKASADDTELLPLQPSGGFEAILGEIGDHPGGDGFHVPIIRAVASYVAREGAENLDIEALYEIVRARVLAADKSHHDTAYVERMASREHIIPAIEQAIAKFGQSSRARRKPRQVPGVAPHFAGRRLSAALASAALRQAIDGFFRP
jgi:hypothetical protein